MKITKKSLHMGWNSHDTEIIKIKKEMRELKASVLRLEKLTDEKLLDTPEPKLKVLDQSVFDGLDAKWRFAAVDKNGCAYKFTNEPNPQEKYEQFMYDDMVSGNEHQKTGTGYDTTNWQNSLIERDKVGLTGNELCLKLLSLDLDVICDVKDGDYRLIFAHDGEFFISSNNDERECHKNVTPINNQGEPLTAADVGL